MAMNVRNGRAGIGQGRVLNRFFPNPKPGRAPGGSTSAAAAAGAPAPGKPKAPGYHPMAVLKGLGTGTLLNPKQLSAAARALATLETRPETRGYRLLAKQLGNEKNREAEGLSKLGERTEGAISDVYKNIAQSEAENMARQQTLSQGLAGQSANIAKEGSANLAQMQTGALGDYTNQLQMRGAQNTAGGAQQALANAVAAQQAQQNAASQASQQFANQSAMDFGNYRSALGASTQMQGASQIGGIGRDIASRITESNAKYNTNIGTARSKVAEARAGMGAKTVKDLLGLREGEQKFLLGEQAVKGNKESLAASVAQNAASNAIAQQNANSSATSAGASLLNAQVNAWEAKHPHASSGEAAKVKHEVKQGIREVHALIPGLEAEFGSPPDDKRKLNLFIAKMNSKASADPALVRKVLTKWWRAHHGAGKTGPGQGGITR